MSSLGQSNSMLCQLQHYYHHLAYTIYIFRYLQDSKLEFLDDDTFELVKLLTELNLRGNSLQILPEGIFTGLPLNDL